MCRAEVPHCRQVRHLSRRTQGEIPHCSRLGHLSSRTQGEIPHCSWLGHLSRRTQGRGSSLQSTGALVRADSAGEMFTEHRILPSSLLAFSCPAILTPSPTQVQSPSTDRLPITGVISIFPCGHSSAPTPYPDATSRKPRSSPSPEALPGPGPCRSPGRGGLYVAQPTWGRLCWYRAQR